MKMTRMMNRSYRPTLHFTNYPVFHYSKLHCSKAMPAMSCRGVLLLHMKSHRQQDWNFGQSHGHQGCGTSSLKRIVACVCQEMKVLTSQQLFIRLSGAMQVQEGSPAPGRRSRQRFALPRPTTSPRSRRPPLSGSLSLETTLHLRPDGDGGRESFALTRALAKYGYLAMSNYMPVRSPLQSNRIVLTRPNTHEFTHTYTHTYILTYTHTYTHTYVRTYIHKYIHT